MGKICCFTGHRPKKFSFRYNENHPDCRKLKNLLREEIEKAIQNGYDYFISGMALGVDMWAAEIVLELQEKYPHIRLEAAIPCANQERMWPSRSQQRYNQIKQKAQVLHFVSSEAYQRELMLKRDDYMVKKSDLLIAVYDGTPGGTGHTFKQAKKKPMNIVRINPKDFSVTYLSKEQLGKRRFFSKS